MSRGQVICDDRSHLMGEIPPHMSLAEACFWFSVNNLMTIGFGGLVGTSASSRLCFSSPLNVFLMQMHAAADLTHPGKIFRQMQV